jgi:hypothetical protein
VRAAHSEEDAIHAALDREQGESVLSEALLRPRRDVVGVLAGQWLASELPHDLRVGR